MGSTATISVLLLGVIITFVALKLKLHQIEALFAGAEPGAPEVEFKAKRLLTPNELEFLGRLEAAVPEYRFHAQVAMGALLDPVVSASNGSTFGRTRAKFAQKIVDYVAVDPASGDVVALIELDDRTHDPDKDAARDAMTADAGYRTIRWHSRTKPDTASIRAAFF